MQKGKAWSPKTLKGKHPGGSKKGALTRGIRDGEKSKKGEKVGGKPPQTEGLGKKDDRIRTHFEPIPKLAD